MTRIAFLGPRGSFAEAALRTLAIAADAEQVPATSVNGALDMVRRGDVDMALVPIENSIEGSVSLTVDELARGKRLVIVDEVVIPVRFALLGRRGMSVAEVKSVATHPHAQAQVREWLEANLPGVTVIPALSTSAAAAAVADGSAPFDAAVSQPIAADIYDLDVLASDIQDNDDATTRFILVRLPGTLPAPTGSDKTTLSLLIHDDHPGALLAILNEFAARGVNMTRIESRPTKKALGDYYFSVDIEGHANDARVSEALMGLHRICLDVRFLGSYPRHDGKAATVRRGGSDDDYANAREWLEKLKTDG